MRAVEGATMLGQRAGHADLIGRGHGMIAVDPGMRLQHQHGQCRQGDPPGP